MAIINEFGTYILLSLAIAILSVLAQNSILVFIFGCALSYAWLWGTKNKIRPKTGTDHLRIFQLCLGAALGCWGAHLWTGVDPRWFQGALFESMAFFVGLSAFPKDSPAPKTASKTAKAASVKIKTTKVKTKASAKKEPLGLAGILLMVLAVLGFIMEFLFYKDSVNWAFIFMAAVVVLVIGFKWVKKNPIKEKPAGINENHLLAALLGLTAVLRLPFIWSNLAGFQIDEANDLQGAQDFFHNALRTPFATGWSGRATFPFAVFYDFFKVFGQHLSSARFFCVLASIAAVWFFYKLCRYYFSVTVSLVATLMLSFSWWFLWGSFVVFPMMIQDLGVLMSFYFLEKALREGKRIYFWWSGTAVGITVMTYVWGRTALLLVGAWLVVSYLFTEDSKVYRKKLLWGLLAWAGGLLWIFGPFLGWLTINQEFFGRVKELSLMSHVAQYHDYMLPVKTFYYTAISPFITYSADERFVMAGRPLFDRVSSLLFLVGVVLAFMGLRKRSSWMLLLGVATCMPANALAIQNSTPDPTYLNGQRFFCVVPFVYWGAAFGIDWIWSWIRQESQQFKKAARVILIIVLTGTVLWNAKWFYYDFHTTGHWSRLGFNHILISDVARAYSKDHDVYLCAEYTASSVVQFLDGDIKIYPLPDSQHLPLNSPPTRDVVFILRAWGYAEPFKNEVLKKCPHTIVKSYRDGDGTDYLWTLDVPLADLLNTQSMKR
jgi:hypothetical protein